MQATARMASVVSSTPPARRRLIRVVRRFPHVMKKPLSLAAIPKGIKRAHIFGAVLLLLLTVYAGTAVPLSAWLFYHRAGGVPEWLDRAYIPLHWLRDHSELAERFFAWQSRCVIVPAERGLVPLDHGAGPAVTPDPNVDVESRVKDLERYFNEIEPRRGSKLEKQRPEK